MTLMGLPAFLELVIISATITFVMSLIYKFLLKHDDYKELKTSVKEKQKKYKELEKTDKKEAEQALNEMLMLNNKLLKLTMKPMFVSSIFILLTLGLIRDMFPGTIVSLPISLPFLGSSFDWLGWYILISIPLNQFFRTMMGVEL